MSEDFKLNATKKSIARCLSAADMFDEDAFRCMQKDVGHGRPAFNSARDQMIGAKEISRVGSVLRKRKLHLTDLGRQRYQGKNNEQ